MQKQTVVFNFSQGLDTKADPWQIPLGKFLSLENSVFTTSGQLKKRNGYGAFPSPSGTPSYLTTINGNLTAIGTNIQAYSPSTDSWVNKGFAIS